jgi:hypothetical protein
VLAAPGGVLLSWCWYLDLCRHQAQSPSHRDR